MPELSDVAVHHMIDGEPKQVEAVAPGHVSGDMIAVASSNLFGGTHWNGQIRILHVNVSNDGAFKLEPQCARQIYTGVSDVVWLNSLGVAAARDDGVVDILTMTKVGLGNENIDEELNELVHATSLIDHDDICSSVDVCRLTGTLYSGSFDATVKQWDVSSPDAPVSTFHLLSTAPQLVSGRRGIIWDVACCPFDAVSTAIACQDGSVYIWDSREPNANQVRIPVRHQGCAVRSVAWAPSNSFHGIAGLEDGGLALFDMRTQSVVVEKHKVFSGRVQALSCGENSTFSAGSDDGSAAVFALRNSDFEQIAKRRCHSDYVRGIFMHRVHQNMLCTCSWDGSIRLMNYS